VFCTLASKLECQARIDQASRWQCL
jgi:hypothetical protein